eukprot:RCo026221
MCRRAEPFCWQHGERSSNTRAQHHLFLFFFAPVSLIYAWVHSFTGCWMGNDLFSHTFLFSLLKRLFSTNLFALNRALNRHNQVKKPSMLKGAATHAFVPLRKKCWVLLSFVHAGVALFFVRFLIKKK